MPVYGATLLKALKNLYGAYETSSFVWTSAFDFLFSRTILQWLFLWFLSLPLSIFFYQDTPLLLKLSQFSIFTSIHTTFHCRDFSPKITLTLACTGIRILRTCRSWCINKFFLQTFKDDVLQALQTSNIPIMSFQVVWHIMQDEFIQQYKHFEDLIQRCYPESMINLEVTIDDILSFFSNIAQSHWTWKA